MVDNPHHTRAVLRGIGMCSAAITSTEDSEWMVCGDMALNLCCTDAFGAVRKKADNCLKNRSVLESDVTKGTVFLRIVTDEIADYLIPFVQNNVGGQRQL